MRIKEIINILEGEIVVEGANIDSIEIDAACGSDLMSDVMAYVKDNVMLLTGLVTPQVVRTAEMMDIHVITFVRGKTPTAPIIDLAKETGMTIMTTKHPMFIACGKLYQAGIVGKGVRD